MKARVAVRRPSVRGQDVARRKQYLFATLVTSAVLSFIGGTIHVLELGASRMHEMRGGAAGGPGGGGGRRRAAGGGRGRRRAGGGRGGGGGPGGGGPGARGAGAPA